MNSEFVSRPYVILPIHNGTLHRPRRTNFQQAPSAVAADSEEIRAHVETGELELSRLGPAFETFAHRHQVITSKLNKWRDANCRIHSLPPEILADVFLHWIGSNWGLHCFLRHTPFTLAQVCSAWRKFVYGTPMFWTDVAVDLDNVRSINDAAVQGLKRYLKQSATCLISVTFRMPYERPVAPGALSLVQALRPHTSRIQSLNLWTPSSVSCCLREFPGGAERWANLRSLTIQVWSDWDSETLDLEQPFTTFADAPRLTKVTIVAHDTSFADHRTLLLLGNTLPWSQITTLDTRDVFNSLRSVQQILLKSPALEHCSLGLIVLRPEDLPIRSGAVHVLPNLKTFEVEFEYEDEHDQRGAAQFFGAYLMPDLTNLAIAVSYAVETIDMAEFDEHVFSRFGFTLTHLSLDSIEFEEGHMTSVFQHLPVLESLDTQLTQIAVNNEFFSILKYDEDQAVGSTATIAGSFCHRNAPLLPHLHTLIIFEYPRTNATSFPKDVATAIMSRWWSDEELQVKRPGVARLKKVQIVWEDRGLAFDKDDLDDLLKCRKEGMKVYIGGMPREG